jgi:hypothetical protein
MDLEAELTKTGYSYSGGDTKDWAYTVLLAEMTSPWEAPWPQYFSGPLPTYSLPDELTVDHVGFEMEGFAPTISSTVAQILLYVSAATRPLQPASSRWAP